MIYYRKVQRSTPEPPDSPPDPDPVTPEEEASIERQDYIEASVQAAEDEETAKLAQWDSVCLEKGWHPDRDAGNQVWQEIFNGI